MTLRPWLRGETNVVDGRRAAQMEEQRCAAVRATLVATPARALRGLENLVVRGSGLGYIAVFAEEAAGRGAVR